MLTAMLVAAVCLAASDERLEVGGGPPLELVRISAGKGVEKDFLIGKFELMRGQYEAFIRATGYDGKDHPSSKATEPFLADWKGGRCPTGTEKLPMCYLNVHHARAYCAWASKATGRVVRLPTDAEWTLAARGPQGRAYPWGDEWDATRCNIGGDGDGFAESAPVGSFPTGATPEGVMDMAGNIWEWTHEGHLRGGPWCMGPETVRSEVVAREDQDRCDDKFGFRVVVETR